MKGKQRKKFTPPKKTIYTCPHCDKQFADNSSWSCHIRLHSTELPFKCELCDYKCKIKKYLSRHVKKAHTKPVGHQCPVCGKCFHFYCKLRDHMRVHTGEKPHKCSVCDKAFSSTYSLNVHKFIHTGEKPFQCRFCEYACRDNSTIRRHMERHMGISKDYPCSICNKNFKKKETLQLHVEEVHLELDTRKHACVHCNKMFKTKGTLNIHINTVHKTTNRVKCEICGSRVTKNNIQAHMRRHIDVRPYKCSFKTCGRRFKDKGDLKKHSRIHYPDRQYLCHVCNRRFPRRFRFNAHLKLHTNKNNVQCDYCGEMYPTKMYLSRHIKNAHGPNSKNYICDTCGLVTYTRKSIVMHLKYGHGTENDTHCQVCQKDYKEYLSLKDHYLKYHNIIYNLMEKKKEDEITIKDEPVEEVVATGGPPEFIYEVQVEKQEEMDVDTIEVPIIQPQSPQSYPIDSDTITYSKKVLSEDISRSLIERENTTEDAFDDFFIGHVLKKPEDMIDMPKDIVDEKKKERVEKCLEKLLAKVRMRKQCKVLEKLRRRYNRRIKMATSSGNKKEPNSIRYFKKPEMINQSGKTLNNTNADTEIDNDKTMNHEDIDDEKVKNNNNSGDLEGNNYNINEERVDDKEITDHNVNKENDKPINDVKTNDQVTDDNDNKTNDESINGYNAKKTNDESINGDNANKTNDGAIKDDNANKTNDGAIKDDNANKTNDGAINDDNANKTNDGAIKDDNANKTNDGAIKDDNANKTNDGVIKDDNANKTNDDEAISDQEIDDDDAKDSDYKDSDFESNSDEDINKNGRLTFNTHQCYICFKLFKTKNDLKRHCRIHFDICNDKMLKKCPFCGYVTNLQISRHIKVVHNIILDIPYSRIKERDTQNGSKYVFEIDKNCDLEIIPSISNLNKIASMKIDEKNRDAKNMFTGTTKLVRKGNEWVVEKTAVNINKEYLLPEFSREEYQTLNYVGDNYLERLRNLSILAKKKKIKILYPCEGCDKICLTFSALKLHNRKHEVNPKRFAPKVWKHKLVNGKSGKNKSNSKSRKAYGNSKSKSAIVTQNSNSKSGQVYCNTNNNGKQNSSISYKRKRLEVFGENGKIKSKTEDDKLPNRFAAPNPVKNKHKCDKELIEFYKNNIKGGDIEFWQFLKIFNKMSRENVNDFKDLENRYDFGMHNIKNIDESNDISTSDKKVTKAVSVSEKTNITAITETSRVIRKKTSKRKKAFTRAIMISKKEYLKRLEIKNEMRQKLQECKS